MTEHTEARSVRLHREADAAQERYHALRREARSAEQAEEAARRPAEPRPEPDLPEYVLFSRYTSGRVYHYAAVGWNIGGHVRWAVTGQEARRFNWPGLLDFIGAANWSSLYHVTDTVSLMPPGAEVPAAETVGPFGAVGRPVVPPNTGNPRYLL